MGWIDDGRISSLEVVCREDFKSVTTITVMRVDKIA